MTKQFSGVWPAMLTPITPNGDVNLPAIDQLVELFVSQQLGGLYITGSTGQWPLLGPDRRRQIVERTTKASSGRIPVMVHVGANSTEESVALAKQAGTAGADAVSAVAPPYYPYSADAVFEHYRRIGESTELPLYVYHLSNTNVLNLDAEDYVARLLKLPNIAGMKFTDGNLFQLGLLQAAARGKLQLFSGADEVLCQAVLCGTIGAIGTFYNVWGTTCKKMRQAVVTGDVASGTEFMLRFQSALAKVIRSAGIFKFLRRAMQLKYDIDVGLPIPPLGAADREWSDDDVRQVLTLVEGE
ncbi:MAG: dihydrodipicolinate synthase family protein [Planctomycetaceae bacterium]|nr:dihydrodipicolinate synthase family protein [Planctomycetaceae bacterium]